MTERLLQFIWRFQYFNKGQLESVAGEPLHVIFAGQLNTNQGPDFSNAKINIDGTIWAGTVELHIRTTDWDRHHHQQDKKYNNVILHVVWEDDGIINAIPVLELKTRVPKLLLQRYEEMMLAYNFIPCERKIHVVDDITWTGWKTRLVAERLIQKAKMLDASLELNHAHWEETFWWLLARNFGMSVNTEAFEAIARSLPLSILAKYKHQPVTLEAILLGQAGLLERKFKEAYPQLLQKEYKFYQRKNAVKPVNTPVLFLRMRPGNFPTIRLAQLAALVHESAHLFSKIKEANCLKDVKSCFDITTSEYWDTHYRFDKISAFKKKSPGAAMIDNIIINTVCPALFAYGSYHGEQTYKDRAVAWLEESDPEMNAVTRGFQKAGVQIASAADSQALIELKNEYCNPRRCLECTIGHALLKNTRTPC